MATGILAMLAPKGKESSSEPDEDDATEDGYAPDSNVKKLLRIAFEAQADGDIDAAVDAMSSAIDACMKQSTTQPLSSKYGPTGG